MILHRGIARRRISPIRTIAVLAVFAAMLCAAVFAHGAPARAAVSQYTVSFGGWVVGGFVSSNGQLVYCVEPGAFEPSGPQHHPVEATTLPGFSAKQSDGTGWDGWVAGTPVSGDALRRMNWLLTTYGQTTDPDIAAAVQFAVWFLREDPGANDWLVHHVRWVQAHGGTWHTDRAYGMVDEAYAAVAASMAEPEGAALSIALGDEFATGALAYPAGTTRVDIDGAAFDGGASSIDVGPAAGTATWRAVLHENGWESGRTVRASGEWVREVTEWPAALMLHTAVVAGQQTLGSMVGPVTANRRLVLEPTEVHIGAQFHPVLATQVESRFVSPDEGRFADRVTFAASEGSPAPWAARSLADGTVEYAPIAAQGVLYGPFADPLETADAAPEGAPVAARAEIIAERGPGEYLAVADSAPREAGYYSWVWSIDEAQQAPEVRAAALLPEGYLFTDRFGLAEEGQTVPMALRWSTALDDRELPLDDMVLRDRVTLSVLQGSWLNDAQGVPLPVVLRLSAYATETEPERGAAPSEGAVEVARELVTASAPGEIEAPPMLLPFETRGWVTVQACLFEEDQSEAVLGHVEEWCDDFGVPEETARISEPEVRTEAQPEAVVGETFRDAAIVDGKVPAGADLGFVYYLEPRAGAPKFDASWNPVSDEEGKAVMWSAAELAELTEEERCLAQPVAVTARVAVPGTGRVDSPPVLARSAGTGYWVEDLAMPHPETGETVELHRGACGLENERTVVVERPEPLASTGGLDPRVLLFGAAPVAGAGLIMLLATRRHMQRLSSPRK